MSKKENFKIIKFPNTSSEVERQVEAILFSAEEPLDIQSIQMRLKKRSDIKKILESAIANAEHNQGLDVDSLFVSTIAVDESFTMKRIRARARGRADRFFKRSCNISLTLEEKDK